MPYGFWDMHEGKKTFESFMFDFLDFWEELMELWECFTIEHLRILLTKCFASLCFEPAHASLYIRSLFYHLLCLYRLCSIHTFRAFMKCLARNVKGRNWFHHNLFIFASPLWRFSRTNERSLVLLPCQFLNTIAMMKWYLPKRMPDNSFLG